MADCCSPSGYRRFFNRREARRRLRRYRRKGLDPMARSMAGFLTAQGLGQRTVLEIGGGVGDMHIEMLRAGASRAASVELSPGYEEAAADLLRETGFEDRVDRRIGDFVAEADQFEPADEVVMNRVVCCYPDMEKMMAAAFGKAKRHLAATFPRNRWYNRWAIGAGNWYLRRRNVGFQAYVHPPGDIMQVASEAGFEVVHRDRNLVWQAVVFRRAEAPAA